MEYRKPFLSLDDQVKRLRKQGLIIENEQEVLTFLKSVSFYRLRAYTHAYQDNEDPSHPFKEEVSFNIIRDSYDFDRKLRLLLFDAIERIEIALRTQLVYEFSRDYGSDWYTNPELYIDKHLTDYSDPSRKVSYYEATLDEIESDWNRSKEVFVGHFNSKYTSSEWPPSWIAFEVLTMGSLSRLFSKLSKCEAKLRVSRYFGLNHPTPLESWFRAITQIRNICAHHSRLYNRKLPEKTLVPNKTDAIFLQNHITDTRFLFMPFSAIIFLMNRIKPQHTVKHRWHELLHEYPKIPQHWMGFKRGWENEPLWRG